MNSNFKKAAAKAKKKFGDRPFGDDEGFGGKGFGKKKAGKKGGFKKASNKAFGRPNKFDDEDEGNPFAKRG